MSQDVAMTSVHVTSEPIPIEYWGERQSFCNETYRILETLAPTQGFDVEGQMISHEISDVLAFASIGFAKESHETWVEWFYLPLSVERLFPLVLPMVPSGWLDLPSAGGRGIKDKELTETENAQQIIEAMRSLARDCPSAANYADFLQSGPHPAMYREIEAINLIANGTNDEARRLCDDVLAGDVRYSSLYRVLPPENGEFSAETKVGIYWRGGPNTPPEGALTFIHVISDWLYQQERNNTERTRQ